ncbi:hypothetical protein [Fructobacillus parabroussonetiae]|uniref:Uncharacterized protein n=1 Tax=Fructobacillus parabroussonetiae TaxID=2713174 RepID=A0ABS5QVJ1_9LACO|nr:hypothetical protein [Fructobacillus parabroussonetiae]MBS9337221.1 hypothetical protein [Fructobacillus parabroussonetiae]
MILREYDWVKLKNGSTGVLVDLANKEHGYFIIEIDWPGKPGHVIDWDGIFPKDIKKVLTPYTPSLEAGQYWSDEEFYDCLIADMTK